MTNRDEPNYASYKAGTHKPKSTSEMLFSGATYMNMLVSLAAFAFSLTLFVSAHEQFRMLGARDSTGLGGSGAVDNGPAVGDGLQFGPCLWMQATSVLVVLLTPVIRIASRMWGEKRLDNLKSAARGRQSTGKV